METRRMWPEIINSGFVWLLFFWSIIDWNLSLDEVREQFASIVSMNTGQISAASGLIVAASYFLGALARRILGWARSSGAKQDLEEKKQKDLMIVSRRGTRFSLKLMKMGIAENTCLDL